MIFSFHPGAEEEFGAAVAWYEERETGLGLDFAAEEGDRLHILAVMHLRRRPDYWRDRLPS